MLPCAGLGFSIRTATLAARRRSSRAVGFAHLLRPIRGLPKVLKAPIKVVAAGIALGQHSSRSDRTHTNGDGAYAPRRMDKNPSLRPRSAGAYADMLRIVARRQRDRLTCDRRIRGRAETTVRRWSSSAAERPWIICQTAGHG